MFGRNTEIFAFTIGHPIEVIHVECLDWLSLGTITTMAVMM